MSKWSRAYWVDLGERVGATLIGALITMLTADQSGAISGNAQQWWLFVGLPTVLALLKGILANLSDAESGASAVPSPPAPELVEPYEGRHVRDEAGRADVVGILAVVVLVLVILALLGLL